MVVTDDELEDTPPQQRAGREIGVSQALRRLQFKALEEGPTGRASNAGPSPGRARKERVGCQNCVYGL
jgi:hypothetical protein